MPQFSSLLSPLQRYQQDLLSEAFVSDAAQEGVVNNFQSLYELLKVSPKRSLWARLSGRPPVPVKGLYLWGGVGRGKTYLMDIFFDALPFEQKMRTHFHRFMRRVHDELFLLKEQKNPLLKVADIIAAEARVICFDEFFVVDITDAMILAGLLEALFERGVTLVATSNIEPEGLYRDGLQRERFLPAIDLLLMHTRVVNVDGGVDYRLRALQQAALYYSSLDDGVEAELSACFDRLAPDVEAAESDVLIVVNGRAIAARRRVDDVIWFDFSALCDGPRSQRDYIEIAHEYHAVLISNVPQLGQGNDDQARRFIYLVDEFYDRAVKLVISAEQPIGRLYGGGGRLSFEFQRTQSRLLEMQSEAYLARPHKP